jgi:hypothetical protein
VLRTLALCLWSGYLGALAGTCSRESAAPVRVELHETEHVEQREQESERKVEHQVADEKKVERRTVERTRIAHPDGTTVEHQVETFNADTERHQETARVEVREIERVVYRDREIEKKVELVPRNWRAGALVGLDVSRASLVPPSPGPLVFGAHVERRIAGPVWVGAWGVTSGAVGLSLAVEF